MQKPKVYTPLSCNGSPRLDVGTRDLKQAGYRLDWTLTPICSLHYAKLTFIV